MRKDRVKKEEIVGNSCAAVAAPAVGNSLDFHVAVGGEVGVVEKLVEVATRSVFSKST